MPNWCDNSIRLYNEDKTKIDALEAEMSKKNDDGHSMAEPFNHLCPNPAGEWQYDWSVSNWGTKWEASIIDWNRDSDNEITIYCDTAWSPPTVLFEYLVEEGWEVNAIYHEPGMGFCGIFTTEDGDDYYEYDITDPESVEDLPEECIEFGDLRTRAEEYMVEQMAEEWGDAERTEWIDVSVTPVRDGYYEITTEGWDFPQFCKFENGAWVNWNHVTKWRGLAEEPNSEWDPIKELDKIVDETKMD